MDKLGITFGVVFVQLKTVQASVVFVFYLGNSVALTQFIHVLEFALPCCPNCYIQYTFFRGRCQPLFYQKRQKN